jgi:hypothetical protein
MSVPFLQKLPLFLLVLICSIAFEANAQCTKQISELPAAPELLGFHLGMTKEEIKVYVPQSVFGRKDHFGVSKTTINPAFDATIDKSKFPNVRSISLDLLDDRLTSLWIGFDDSFKVQTIEDFVKLISDSLKVPNNWQTGRGRGLQLRCADFQLQVSTIAGSPSLRVVDVGADDLVASRRQAKEEADAAAENGTPEEPELTGDKQAKVYYLTTCQPPKEIPEQNKIMFKSAEEAEKAGFKLAKGCH